MIDDPQERRLEKALAYMQQIAREGDPRDTELSRDDAALVLAELERLRARIVELERSESSYAQLAVARRQQVIMAQHELSKARGPGQLSTRTPGDAMLETTPMPLGPALLSVARHAKAIGLHTLAEHTEGIARAMEWNGPGPEDARAILDQLRGALFTLTDVSRHSDQPDKAAELLSYMHDAIALARRDAGQ